ncbi:MAG: hypothetical protein S4CHLAM7_12540 [Chlamydiae bacterium]|nr:hypothetical protein [Chlamydiota bacterium]
MRKLVYLISILGIATGFFFLKMHKKSELPSWMHEQITCDLSHYDPEDLKSKRLKEFFKQSNPNEFLIFYQIKDNKVYWTKNWEGEESIDRLRKMTRLLNRVVKKGAIPDTEFILTVHDGLSGNHLFETMKLPLFGFAKKIGTMGILVPDPLSDAFARHSRKSIAKANKRLKYAWRKKLEVAFWRGGTTGDKPYEIDTWFQLPRSKLALLTKYYPEMIDSGFTSFVGIDPEVKKDMEFNLTPVSWTVHKDHLNYKYLVIPDGNTCTYPRYYLGLFSNSVVFKQESNQIQWFYRALIPYEHYVPVASDFSDLPEKVEWAKENDDKMKQIAKSATDFVNENLLPQHINTYMGTLLKEYSKLRDEDVVLLKEAKISISELK